jgi:hypothetical protein
MAGGDVVTEVGRLRCVAEGHETDLVVLGEFVDEIGGAGADVPPCPRRSDRPRIAESGDHVERGVTGFDLGDCPVRKRADTSTAHCRGTGACGKQSSEFCVERLRRCLDRLVICFESSHVTLPKSFGNHQLIIPTTRASEGDCETPESYITIKFIVQS